MPEPTQPLVNGLLHRHCVVRALLAEHVNWIDRIKSQAPQLVTDSTDPIPYIDSAHRAAVSSIRSTMVLEEERRQQGIDSMILEAVTGPPEQVAPCIRNALEVSEASVTQTEPCMFYQEGLLAGSSICSTRIWLLFFSSATGSRRCRGLWPRSSSSGRRRSSASAPATMPSF